MRASSWVLGWGINYCEHLFQIKLGRETSKREWKKKILMIQKEIKFISIYPQSSQSEFTLWSLELLT